MHARFNNEVTPAELHPDPLGEVKRSPDPLAAIRGLLLRGGGREGREGTGEMKGRGGRGGERKGRRRGGKGTSLVQF